MKTGSGKKGYPFFLGSAEPRKVFCISDKKERENMKKRAMSLLLALVMMLALLPAQTWATDTVDEPGETEEQTMPAEPQKEALKAEKTAEAPQVQAEAVTSGTCGAEGDGSNLRWSLSGGVLTISGTGAMKNWKNYYDPSPWEKNDQITHVVIESGVTSIGNSAFWGCFYLTDISMPDTVTRIGGEAIYACLNLTSLDISCVKTFDAGALCNSGLTEVAIPSGITELPGNLLSSCKKLTKVTLPEGITKIGVTVFASCESLTSIKIPSTVTSIGSYAFDQSAIQNISIPDGVTEIGERAFSYCPNLTELVIPDSVLKIGHKIVEGSSKLRSIHLGKGVENIFWVNSIAGANEFRTFQDCESLTYITVDPDNQYYTAEDNVLFNKDKTEVYRSAPGKTGSYTLPNSVKTMENTFIFEDSQLSSIVIPEGVQGFPRCTFKNCTNLKEIWLPKSLKVVGQNAFVASMEDLGADPIEDVYYAGSKDDWNDIYFADGGRPSGTVHYNAETPLLPGCPTGGDKVQIQDVAFVYEFLTGQKQGDDAVKEGSAQWNAMNVNGDETVDVYDLQTIYEIACGLQ
jgi:hypothetical protein